MPEEKMITITEEEYQELKNEATWVACLEATGVRNWDGFDIAGEMYYSLVMTQEDEIEDEGAF